MKKITLILSIFILISCNNKKTSDNDILTIGTFNMEWLGDGIDDNKTRTEKDFQQIADILTLSGMECIGIQEVENDIAIQNIVSKMDNCSFKLSKHNSKQKVGIIYKKYLDVEVIEDYKPLILEDVGQNMRPGLVVNIGKNDFKITMMIVHLKSTSRYDSTDELRRISREVRALQANILNKWADSIKNTSPECKFAIIGDFNDYPSRKNNPTLTELASNQHLHFLTKDQNSCKFNYIKSIDHIVIGSSLKQNYVNNSIFQLDFNAMLNEKEAKMISDHCPVMAQFRLNK